MDLNSLTMRMMENFKKEIQEITGKQPEEETQKSLRELQENTTKQVMELNKTIKDIKMEVETIKKTQRETTLEMEILGKKSGYIDASISNRIQEMEERISGAEDSIEKWAQQSKIMQNAKNPNSKHPENPAHN
jgi:hypothetical protein